MFLNQVLDTLDITLGEGGREGGREGEREREREREICITGRRVHVVLPW